MSPKKSTTTPPVLSALKGILFGLAFFIPGILIVSDVITADLKINKSFSIPVIANLSQDFKTGVVAAGDLFSRKADRFYGVERKVEVFDIDKDTERAVPIYISKIDRINSKVQRDTTTDLLTFVNKPKDRIVRANTDSIAYAAWSKKAIEKKLVKKLGKKKSKDVRHYLKYIEKYKDLASKEMYYNKIPASVTLAQGLLESNAGKSYLARVCKNHFGIKCRPKKGFRKDGKITHGDFTHNRLAYNCKQVTDDNKWDRFEMYNSDEISYHRHSNLLTANSRYNWMINKYRTGKNYKVEHRWFGKESVPYYAAWAIGLKTSGYATNNRYAQKLAYIIETYELWRIDYSVIFWS